MTSYTTVISHLSTDLYNLQSSLSKLIASSPLPASTLDELEAHNPHFNKPWDATSLPVGKNPLFDELENLHKLYADLVREGAFLKPGVRETKKSRKCYGSDAEHEDLLFRFVLAKITAERAIELGKG